MKSFHELPFFIVKDTKFHKATVLSLIIGNCFFHFEEPR